MIKMAIVGGGPNGMYFLNGLHSVFKELSVHDNVSVTLYDRHGYFGSGWPHSPAQAKTSMLNRIVGQLSFAPDKTNTSSHFFPKSTRITFSEWLEKKYQATHSERYKLNADDFPTRELYGESLVEICDALVNEVRQAGIGVTLIKDTIKRISKSHGKYQLTGEFYPEPAEFDIVLLATGHQESKDNFYLAESLKKITEYYNFAYPLFDVPDWQHKSIAVIGMGLTAIDTLLYYTENKGGRFHRDKGKLRYEASGNEPKKLYALSRSGYFTYSRPHNAKEVDLAKYEHQGYFFTRSLIDQMRQQLGEPAHPDSSPENHALQLDFDVHVFPLLMLELQLCYYRILFGPEVLALMKAESRPLVEQFIAGNRAVNLQKESAINWLTQATERLAREAIFLVRRFLNDGITSSFHGVPIETIVKRYVYVISAQEAGSELNLQRFSLSALSAPSPWAHKADPEAHLFNWDMVVDPIRNMDFSPETPWRERLLAFMHWDRRQSEQGNLYNPYKGACDDVFRDLRQTVVYAVDFGGTSPASYNNMLKDFYAVHNRAANGNCIALMEKMEALIEADVVDVTYAQSNIQIQDDQVWLHSLSHAGKYTRVDAMIDAKLHNFSVKKAKNSLFRDLIDAGIASYWVHKDRRGVECAASGFNITRNFQFINRDGKRELFFCVGQPSEGIMFFQNGSIRPNVNHHVANDLLACMTAVKSELQVLLQQEDATLTH
ncbi:FAD/NAD(P)-binding protein [Xenorhabdus bovienii]|uniref:FAD/NAD(P)-binding protein n=1 Tax=Xenorhabdus bovienii TaxID=40576 RepID=UPI0023B2EFDA|nr:FAD/NAD(P)-binding protein [Xenorhabdus bovienii]MDE9447138.1 FAD/NAD(P)-binding protein [Xenorhabdus bovienii]MDE9536414.1 FAD/NAD(P)-binding protein [Xenorhabdus bovienii]MDE9589594.1 FAD/NAD(P)-binding protein [Xenorhabdus bovienii]